MIVDALVYLVLDRSGQPFKGPYWFRDMAETAAREIHVSLRVVEATLRYDNGQAEGSASADVSGAARDQR